MERAFAGLVKSSLIDFPGRVSAVVFLPGCNLRCPYCHNPELADYKPGEADAALVPIEDVRKHLLKRKNVLSGVAISGGEPLLSAQLRPLILFAKANGYAVKLDTNAVSPQALASLLESPETRPDMLAADVKTSPERYRELAPGKKNAGELLTQTLALLARDKERQNAGALAPMSIEYRTVLVPSLVGGAEIKKISEILPQNAEWKLTAFRPGRCLDPSMNDTRPYGDEETQNLLRIAQTLQPRAALR